MGKTLTNHIKTYRLQNWGVMGSHPNCAVSGQTSVPDDRMLVSVVPSVVRVAAATCTAAEGLKDTQLHPICKSLKPQVLNDWYLKPFRLNKETGCVSGFLGVT